MDLSTLMSYDPSDMFEDIFPSSSSTWNENQQFENYGGLFMDPMRNESANNVSRFVAAQRQPMTFDPIFVDNTAGQMIHGMQETLFDNDDIFDDIPTTNCVSNDVGNDLDFPWGNEYHEASSSSDVMAQSPVDGIGQQSSPHHAVGIDYEPRAPRLIMTAPAYTFGSTQMTCYVPQIPVVLTYDRGESKAIEKVIKKKRSVSPSPPDPPRMNEWYLRDDNGRRRRPLLHEFLRLLLNNRNYSEIVGYTDKRNAIFKFHQRERAAQMWGLVKGRNGSSKMTYDKLARGIRYYYGTEVMCPTPGRFTFRFGSASGFGSTWVPF